MVCIPNFIIPVVGIFPEAAGQCNKNAIFHGRRGNKYIRTSQRISFSSEFAIVMPVMGARVLQTMEYWGGIPLIIAQLAYP